MPKPSGRFCLVFLLLLFFLGTSLAQDTLVAPRVVTAMEGPILALPKVERLRVVPRSAVRAHPKVALRETKPPDVRKKFQMPSFWKKENLLRFDLNESAYSNWKAGGNNAIAVTGNLNFERDYQFRYLQWFNNLNLRYGVNVQEGRKPRKSEDAIRFSSSFGYRNDTIIPWYYSVKLNFNTQFSNGYKYPNRTAPISRFMAPGYLFLGAGTTYAPENRKLKLYISPVTLKSTFVLDQNLADSGAFGVTPAVRDSNGNIITPGKNRLTEFGFLVTNDWENEIFKNMFLKHQLSLYTDYINSFGNIDVDWQLNLKLVVNKYISANIGTHLIFDDDVKFDEVQDANGTIIDPGITRIQLLQTLAVGATYSF